MIPLRCSTVENLIKSLFTGIDLGLEKIEKESNVLGQRDIPTTGHHERTRWWGVSPEPRSAGAVRNRSQIWRNAVRGAAPKQGGNGEEIPTLFLSNNLKPIGASHCILLEFRPQVTWMVLQGSASTTTEQAGKGEKKEKQIQVTNSKVHNAHSASILVFC